MNKKLRLYGFSENDRKVFSSYLSIIENKTKYDWEIVSDWDFHLVFIDVVCDSEGLIEKKLQSKGYSVVVYGDPDQVSGRPNIILRPLRASNILQALDGYEGVSQAAVPASGTTDLTGSAEKLYRLNRWPAKDIMSTAPKSSRLAAAFMQGSKSASRVARDIDISEQEVVNFVNKCCLANIMTERNVVEDAPQKTPAKSKNFHLFEKIRQKFGARKSHG
ncbi:hypothetical protein TDB9533_04343 [Thalassocella blandensis]|nr:hypothetical protein TDB9533_04343 [Thalassocella blandensis]